MNGPSFAVKPTVIPVKAGIPFPFPFARAIRSIPC